MLISCVSPPLPEKRRVYDNHVLNSSVWDHFKPRAGDVIICASLKAGTTWMQTIVGHLIFHDCAMPGLVWELSPWLDRRFASVEESLQLVEAQTHRRFIKTHLPLDALPYFSEVQYIQYFGQLGQTHKKQMYLKSNTPGRFRSQ